MADEDFRLPDSVKPSHYYLLFDVDLPNFKFSGKEEVDIEIEKPTSSITLHSIDLQIENVELLIGNETIKPNKITPNKKAETITLEFDQQLEGKAKLKMSFEGKKELKIFYNLFKCRINKKF